MKQDKKWPTPQDEGKLPIDIYETDKEFVIRTVLAGVNQEDLDISIVDNIVTISGNRLDPMEDAKFTTKEIFWGPFKRTCTLPTSVDSDNSEATLNSKGMLTLSFPKIEK